MVTDNNSTNWFVAEIVVLIKVQGTARMVVHINLVLVSGTNLKAAIRRATKLGTLYNNQYLNPSRKKVSIRYLGIKGVHAVHDALENGCELLYEERYVNRLSKVKRLIQNQKELLTARSTWKMRAKANYTSEEVVRALIEKFRSEQD